MKNSARNRTVSPLVVAAFLSTCICAAAQVAPVVEAGIEGDNDVQSARGGTADPAGLAGCYDVKGIDSEEIPYIGELCILVVGDRLYGLTWTQMEEDEGLVSYKGRGVFVGDDLFAVWSEDGSEYDCYLHLFDIDPAAGTLQGVRVDVGGATSTQTATREGGAMPMDWSEPGQLAGSYAVASSDEFDGKHFTATHVPTAGDDAYDFLWSGGGDLEGFGVRDGNSVVIVANPVGQMSGTCGSITYSINRSDRTLVGTFYTPDSLKGTTPQQRGEELATPRE